jgi:single-stranded-DNA-specific exonuclease
VATAGAMVGDSAPMKSAETLLAAMAQRAASSNKQQTSARPIRRRACAPGELAQSALPALLQRLYAARGLSTVADLDLGLTRLLPVASLENTGAAADLLAAHRRGSIVIVGDFDADGATSTALMLRALRQFGFDAVDFLVPNRFEYGYGLTPPIVELAAARKPTLIVTVDNGISSVAGVQRARELGMQVLITDHHLPGSELPAADVIVNPNVPGSRFGSRALAGVGVAFYVLAALRRKLAEAGELPAGAPGIGQYLDLVALGTVADLVPLDANNRILVSQGLARIRAGRCVPGISLLLEIAQRSAAELTASDLGFAVGPRLNAAGRLDDMSIGIRCLTEDDVVKAREAAVRLDQLNVERREIEARMQSVAIDAVKQLGSAAVGSRMGVCLYEPGWHQGVVGLVASRIKDRLNRPVIAFAPAGDGELRGSARSVPGLHIRDVLDAIATREPDLIERFGGHAMAAGLSLREAHLDRFARSFDAEVVRCLAGRALDDAIVTDGELGADEICLATARLLRDAGPWGQGFVEPVFDGEFEVDSTRAVGVRHLKLTLAPLGTKARFEAMAFNFLDPETQRPMPAGRVRAVFRLSVNSYRGTERLQLIVDHLQDAEAGP